MRRQATAALVIVPLLAFGAASCGGGGGRESTTASGTGTSSAADIDKMRQYATCMRANGVDMPDPEPDGRLTMKQSGDAASHEEKLRAAEARCRHLMPDGGKPSKPRPDQLAKLREESRCMRENGVPDFPDPDPETGGIKIDAKKGGSLDPESPTFKKAQHKCGKTGDHPRIRSGGAR